ncbi:MAG: hypothetical protein ACO34E_15355 [Limisphaerales bacterium]
MNYPVYPKRPAKHLRWMHTLLLTAATMLLCQTTRAEPPTRPSQATGSVEIEWHGKGGPDSTPKRAFAALAAFPAHLANDPRGHFIYAVLNPDDTPHRIIQAELFQVTTLPSEQKAWMTGMVVSDEKFHYCSGNHDTDTTHTEDSCGGDHETDPSNPADSPDTHEEGCSHSTDPAEDDTSHDSGCSHDDTTDTSHDDGGCSDSHDTDGETHDDGCSGSSGHDGGSAHPNGKDSRVGQIVVVKLFDGGSPGALNDHITWKWFAEPANETELQAWLDTDPTLEPKKLCKKAILGGNLTVHRSQ